MRLFLSFYRLYPAAFILVISLLQENVIAGPLFTRNPPPESPVIPGVPSMLYPSVLAKNHPTSMIYEISLARWNPIHKSYVPRAAAFDENQEVHVFVENGDRSSTFGFEFSITEDGFKIVEVPMPSPSIPYMVFVGARIPKSSNSIARSIDIRNLEKETGVSITSDLEFVHAFLKYVILVSSPPWAWLKNNMLDVRAQYYQLHHSMSATHSGR
ncbi:hypothetical protein GGU10DRAFT_42943 [Lentinula aff. detonsa]|uniref:Uncharacterized protein n=1 Tax=Lentinula aff. detonsa TaxID=2804958 RepID=A0AA38NR18_9AGAR|nr:hypothetical protein GGU10DRAFT_42943 [Lentinula aff. detonsa]